MNRDKLESQLRVDEGVRARIYQDTATPPRWTGGVGRNLTDRGFSDDEIALMLKNDITLAERELDRVAPWWRNLNEPRQNVMLNMMFNLGAPRLLGFAKFLVYAEAGRFDAAANEMLDSAWSRQVGARALRLASLMRKGEF